jgi:DNA-binding CsgD family transcriptional regulator
MTERVLMPRQTRKSAKAEQEKAAVTHVSNSTTTPSGPGLIPEHILEFLNTLPMTGDSVEWITAFRTGLQKMLGDVDRVALGVNINCDLQHPERYRQAIDIWQHSTTSHRSAQTAISDPHIEGETQAEKMLEEFRQLGYPLDDYHLPLSFNYYYAGQAYLATILLFRDRTKQPISASTVQGLKEMEPFLIFAFSDLVTRHYYAKPIDRVFTDILNYLAQESGLSVQDVRILSLMLLGYSYKQVADKMELSIDTIRKHMKRIYRKTRTGSLAELFAKYFTPRLGIEGLGEDDSL